ncbi:MAG: hypothetical protein WA705_08420, partial [Candidatus Ozemobacteraceae bacterium]
FFFQNLPFAVGLVFFFLAAVSVGFAQTGIAAPPAFTAPGSGLAPAAPAQIAAPAAAPVIAPTSPVTPDARAIFPGPAQAPEAPSGFKGQLPSTLGEPGKGNPPLTNQFPGNAPAVDANLAQPDKTVADQAAKPIVDLSEKPVVDQTEKATSDKTAKTTADESLKNANSDQEMLSGEEARTAGVATSAACLSLVTTFSGEWAENSLRRTKARWAPIIS